MKNSRILAIIVGALMVSAMALPASAQDLDDVDDESWISLSGTVGTVAPHEFTLDYGNGVIRVEMDDWRDDAEGFYVSQGDKVTVLGRFDDDLIETMSIEAASLYVEDLNTYFYANPADEEEISSPGTRFARRVIGMDDRVEPSKTTVVGTVTDVDGREFTVDAGAAELTVDTAGMAYNPLDVEGYQQVELGDRVRITGKVHAEFFDGRKLAADTVTTLSPAK
jgi:uncharacterized protein YdeI (BOF family)